MAAADTIMTSRLPSFPASSGGGPSHAKMPSTLKFLVNSESGEEESGGLKDTANFRRVQELYSVSMSVCSDGEGYDVVSLTGSDADRIEKARCYVMAMSSPQAYYDVQCSGSIAAILTGPLRAGIERDHLVYLRDVTQRSSPDGSFNKQGLSSSNSTVRVQGMEEHGTGAVSKIHTIIEMVEERGQSSYEVSRTVSSNSETGSSPYPKPVHLDYYGRNDGLRESSYGSASYIGNGELAKGGKLFPLLSRDSSDANMEKRIEYFVKLDFSRELVKSALESLGSQTSENEVMDFLMKVAPGVQPINKSLAGRRRVRGEVGGGQVDEREQQQQPQLQQQPTQRKVIVDPSKLRAVVIDGSNVAMRHGNGQVFSCRGIQIAVDYFKDRGHEKITVFVPEWRKESSRPETPITEQYLLDKLEKEKHLVYTPSRRLNNGRRIVCYDDRYIVRLAHEEGGVIVSNDQFRDLMQEKPDWKKVIEQRLLQFAFVTDYFMPPDDPLGKSGPTLDQFLSKDQRDSAQGSKKVSSSDRSMGMSSKPICPHLGNCTFGKKCRYYHPDREPLQQQPPPAVQKQEQSLTVNSSGHRTPNAASRSATPSPGPDGWTHAGRSYSVAKSDRRGHASNHSSTDDLYHERSYSGGGSMVGLDMTTPTSNGIDVSKLAEELERTSLHLSPSRRTSYNLEHIHQSTTNRVVSSPVYSEGPVEQGRPHNHTFPLVQLPQRDSRGPNVTGDHSYLLNQGGGVVVSQGHTHVSQGPLHSSSSISADHFSRHQYVQPCHLPPDIQQDANCRLLPRDPRPAPQFLVQHSPRQSLYPQQLATPPPPTGANLTSYPMPHLPSNLHCSAADYYTDTVVDSIGSRQSSHSYQTSKPFSNAPSVPGYGGLGIPSSNPHAHHVNITPPMPYSNPHGGIGIDQSNIPIQSLPHFPQAPSQFHSAQHKYSQSTTGKMSHMGQVYPVGQSYQREAESRGGRQELYGAAVSILPGCEQRVQCIMEQHLELTSERDLGLLLQYLHQERAY